jgi:hypothetical protein
MTILLIVREGRLVRIGYGVFAKARRSSLRVGEVRYSHFVEL